jgi:hypothetical protein
MAEPKGQLSTPSSQTIAIAGLTDDAKHLVAEGSTPAARVGQLASIGLFPDAIKYLAHSFAGRPCIAWSLSCARELQPDVTPAEQNAFMAVEKWLADPSDANRRASGFASEEAQLSTPAGCIAMAVFFSEGSSIAPPQLTAVPAPPQVAQKIAAAGIILAVVEEPEKAPERYQRCLHAGLEAAI